MRVLHVVTLITPDGAYGGPPRVAMNQAAALASRSHDVTVAAAYSGYDVRPDTIDGVRVQLFPRSTVVPRTGYAGIRARGMLGWLRTALSDFDVVQVHLARDLVTLPAAKLALRRKPVVLQTHGMIDASDRLLARPLDTFWTKPILRRSSSIMCLTPKETHDIADVAGPGLPLCLVPNGVPVQNHLRPIDWKCPEVLFLARLHPRKRPEVFVQMARELLRAGVNARFTLVGPDEGPGAMIKDLIAQSGFPDRIVLEPPIAPEKVAERMAAAAVYVLPAIDEPWSMTTLEAMAVGRPVVVTDTCGLAPMVINADAGRVVGPGLTELASAVRELLANPTAATEAGRRGAESARIHHGMSAIADKLELIYQDAIRASR